MSFQRTDVPLPAAPESVATGDLASNCGIHPGFRPLSTGRMTQTTYTLGPRRRATSSRLAAPQGPALDIPTLQALALSGQRDDARLLA